MISILEHIQYIADAHAVSGSLNSTCSSPTCQLGFMTDRRQQYLPTMQQIPSSSLYVSEHEWNNFVPPRQAAG